MAASVLCCGSFFRVSGEDARTDAVLMRRNICPFRDSNEDSISVPPLAYRTQTLLFLLLLLLLLLLLQLSFHSVAVVLTLVTNKNKYTNKKQYKNTIRVIQNTKNTVKSA